MKLLGPKKICEGVYRVGGQLQSHYTDCAVYAVTGPDGVVLIDCGTPQGADAIEKNLESIGRALGDVELIIGTHCHFDHVGGAAEIKRRNPRVKLLLHEADADAVSRGDGELTCADWMYSMPFEPVAVDGALREGDTVGAGGVEFEIYSTPGHTPGSITAVADIGGSRVMFPGDSYAVSCPRVGYDFDTLRETWQRLFNLGADVVCPGHESHARTHAIAYALRGGFGSDAIRAAAASREITIPFTKFDMLFYEHIGVFVNAARRIAPFL